MEKKIKASQLKLGDKVVQQGGTTCEIAYLEITDKSVFYKWRGEEHLKGRNRLGLNRDVYIMKEGLK